MPGEDFDCIMDPSYDYVTDLNTGVVSSCDINTFGVSFTNGCVHHTHQWFNCLCLNTFQFGFIPMGNIAAFPEGNAVQCKSSDFYMELFKLLQGSTQPNCMGYRVPVPSNMNINA